MTSVMAAVDIDKAVLTHHTPTASTRRGGKACTAPCRHNAHTRHTSGLLKTQLLHVCGIHDACWKQVPGVCLYTEFHTFSHRFMKEPRGRCEQHQRGTVLYQIHCNARTSAAKANRSRLQAPFHRSRRSREDMATLVSALRTAPASGHEAHDVLTAQARTSSSRRNNGGCRR